jgi:hypothetical protein
MSTQHTRKDGDMVDGIDYLALTPYDWDNDEYNQDFPSYVLADVGYQYEAYEMYIAGGVARYRLRESVSAKDSTWDEFMNGYIKPEHAQDVLTREQFDEYVNSGMVFA